MGYDPFTLCSVSMAKQQRPPQEKTDQAISNPQLSGASSFGALAGYLFGKNDQTTAMKMTTPVFTTTTTDNVDKQQNQRDMSFVLPSVYWGEDGTNTCPQLLEGSGVTLIRQDKQVKAVLMFGGFATRKEVEKRERELMDGLQQDKDWTTRSTNNNDAAATEPSSLPVLFTLAQYNDPFTPPWKRRNEVSVPVFAIEQ